MYFSIFYLLSFSLLISFYFILYFKKVISNPESLLEGFLYEKCSSLKINSQVIHLDFEVKIYKNNIHIDVFGLKDTGYFTEAIDRIYKIIKKKTGRRKIIIAIISNNKNEVFKKIYNQKGSFSSSF